MLNLEATVGGLVLDHPEYAQVLQKHRIDFCCRGERPLIQACREGGVDVSAVVAALDAVSSRSNGDIDLRLLSTSALIEHIVAHHHAYLRQVLPYLSGLAAEVAGIHGRRNERLLELRTTVDELRESLEPHIDDEEQRLFPALVAARGESSPQIRAELESMVVEHAEVGRLLRRLRGATEDYQVPDWGCSSYRVLFAELEWLATDALRHVHTENYVLKPRYDAERP